MTTWPSVTAGSGKSVTYCSLSSPPCSRSTTAFMLEVSDSMAVRIAKPCEDRRLCAVRGNREAHDRATGQHRGKDHVARSLDLLTADALRGLAIASGEGFHQGLVLVLQVLRTFAQ